MICSVKPILTAVLCVVQKEEFPEHAICAKCTLGGRPSIFIRDKAIISSERMLHKDYNRKSSIEKRSLVGSLKGLDAKTT
jgi:hypothetical protein